MGKAGVSSIFEILEAFDQVARKFFFDLIFDRFLSSQMNI